MRKKKATKTKKRRSELNKKLLQILVFLIKFNMLAIPMYLIILSGLQWGLLKDITADLAYGSLIATGIDASIEKPYITVPADNNYFIASVDWDCTGWKSMYALFALIFATGFAMRRKLAGLVLIPVIYLINIIRIWFMFYFASNFGTTHYQLVHSTIWSWGLITAVLLLWILWLKKDFSIILKLFAKNFERNPKRSLGISSLVNLKYSTRQYPIREDD